MQHNLILALEEVRAVERQVIYLLAVDEYLAIIFQLHARQLLDESVEHRTLGHIECIGIIDQRVAAPHHLYLRGLHHNLVQLSAFEVACSCCLFHIHFRSLDIIPPSAHLLHLEVRKGRFIVRVFKLEDIPGWLATDLEVVSRCSCRASDAAAVAVVLPHLHRVHHRRVSVHQRHPHVGNRSFRKTISHRSVH